MTAKPVAGFVRWAQPSDTWISDERQRDVPIGFRLAIVDEFKRHSGLEWSPDPTGRRCRFAVKNRGCGRPSVAVLLRGFQRISYWGYCEQHLYGRHYDNGQLLAAILVRVESGGAA